MTLDANAQPKQASRSRKLWLVLAWVGVVITLVSAASQNWSDTVGYALATAGMFVSARADFALRTWTKVASVGLPLAAVAVRMRW